MGKRLQLSYAYEAKFYPQYGQNTRKNDLPLKKKIKARHFEWPLGFGSISREIARSAYQTLTHFKTKICDLTFPIYDPITSALRFLRHCERLMDNDENRVQKPYLFSDQNG